MKCQAEEHDDTNVECICSRSMRLGKIENEPRDLPARIMNYDEWRIVQEIFPALLKAARKAHKWALLKNNMDTVPWLESLESALNKADGGQIT